MEKSRIVRDASIQRFEYTFEALWKAAQTFLKQNEGVEAGSPKSAVRACFRAGLLGDEQARAAMKWPKTGTSQCILITNNLPRRFTPGSRATPGSSGLGWT